MLLGVCWFVGLLFQIRFSLWKNLQGGAAAERSGGGAKNVWRLNRRPLSLAGRSLEFKSAAARLQLRINSRLSRFLKLSVISVT